MQEQEIEDRFNAAVKVIKSLPKDGKTIKAALKVVRSLPKDGPYQPSHEMMLKFYGLYKQATEGPCKESKPSFYEVIKGYKWRAWSALGNMSQTEAMKTYVDELKKIVETMSYSEDVATFIEALGPFYEYIELPSSMLTDSTQKIIKHHTRSESLDEETMNYEMVSMVNGGDSPKLNGTLDSSGENLSSVINRPVTSEIGSTSVKKKKDFNNDSREASPDLHIMNGDTPLVNGGEGNAHQNTTEINISHEIESSSFENGIKSTHLYALKKMTSDTESDEEYSEPAETPELLQEKQKQRAKRANMNDRNGPNYDSVNFSPSNYRDDSPVLEIETCGGGDASDAGRIRMVQAHQSQQGAYGSRGSRNSSVDQTPTSNPLIGGGGGRRRRRDSEEQRSNVNVDVNVQLVYILQKIHQDLEAVVLRLDSLESQALNQHQNVCSLCRRRLGVPSDKFWPWWWPFPELSARSTFFLLTWPLVLHGGVKFLRYLRARRLRKLASVRVKTT
ncbi:Acyl-CoA-binding domain-containing protein 5 [Armadillidium vulgare]|nr:Acyl-CoA-binding domain-containing protein 5 [Armadillidium vulgare]